MGDPAISNVPADEKPKTPVIPEDFRCPISLELMNDPVIVATGQVCVQYDSRILFFFSLWVTLIST